MSKFIVYKGEPGKSSTYVTSTSTQSEAERKAKEVAKSNGGKKVWVFGPIASFVDRTVDEQRFTY